MQAVPGGRPGPEVLARGGNNTWAPDIIRSGDRYFLYYSAPATQPRSAIGLLIGRTLDPASPDYKWEDAGPVVWSDGVEDCNAIDPGVFRDPADGSLWLTYGSYFGYIRLVQLDPATGKRLHPARQPVNVAINSEASIMIARDGWYYLLVTHGSCCAGASSSYNIRMGRARKVTGPFLDNMGIDMLQGGGKLFAASSGRNIGPGHFGLLDLGSGVEKFSLHYEADLDRGGVSVLDIRPPAGPTAVRMGPHMLQAQQKWTITPAADAGGYAGSPYFRIGIAGTDRVLAATADAELAVLPAFTGAPEQMWRIDQLGDGTYRLLPKTVPGRAATESWAVSAAGSSSPTLARVSNDDRQRWVLKAP
jgi:arabinan endo-1,5-alpha-L-arabinosidase